MGEAIRDLRLLKGMKQEALARCLLLSQQAVSKLEKQEFIDYDKFYEIAQKLSCTDAEIEFVKNRFTPPPRES